MARWVYDFGEADPSKIELLGGKGANLAAMTALGLPVPPGFTITTDAWRSFKGTGTQPAGLSEEIERHLGRLEGVMGRSFGDAQDPLLVSVRSGSPRSMPGMMDTILNVGLTDDTVEGLAAQTGDPGFAWDCYRRLVRMFSETVMQVQRAVLDEVTEMKCDLDGSELRHAKWVVRRSLEVISETASRPFPQDPSEQLRLAIEAVFRSWDNDRARDYRRVNSIPDDLGTAVTIQAMVFGNACGREDEVILVRSETTPEDYRGMVASRGILTSTGGANCHAAVVARAEGKPAVCGASDIRIGADRFTFEVGDSVVRQWDWITIDGSDGAVYLGQLETEPSVLEAAVRGDVWARRSAIWRAYRRFVNSIPA